MELFVRDYFVFISCVYLAMWLRMKSSLNWFELSPNIHFQVKTPAQNVLFFFLQFQECVILCLSVTLPVSRCKLMRMLHDTIRSVATSSLTLCTADQLFVRER